MDILSNLIVRIGTVETESNRGDLTKNRGIHEDQLTGAERVGDGSFACPVCMIHKAN